MLGLFPLGAAPISTPNAGITGVASSLGCIATFGTPVADWTYTTYPATLGYIASFGSHVGIPNVHYPESLGSVITFGHPTTPGDVTTEPETVGYVARFGHPIAIKFKRRAIA